MAATATLPLYMSLGAGAPIHVADWTISVDEGEGTLSLDARQLAEMLRAAADNIEATLDETGGAGGADADG